MKPWKWTIICKTYVKLMQNLCKTYVKLMRIFVYTTKWYIVKMS